MSFRACSALISPFLPLEIVSGKTVGGGSDATLEGRVGGSAGCLRAGIAGAGAGEDWDKSTGCEGASPIDLLEEPGGGACA